MMTSPGSIKGFFVRPLALAALLLGMAACSGDFRTDRTIAAERANAYVAAHPELPAELSDDIRHLRARVGMTMEQAIAAWGRPAAIKRYRNGAQQHWFFGCDWPHHCSNSDEDRMFPTPEEIFSSQIIFENGIATDVRSF